MAHASGMVIVCFGDSLTVGFQTPSADNPAGLPTPYGNVLQAQLGMHAQVIISGLCGELTGQMVLRFSDSALRHGPTIVAILGGTNDLGWNVNTDDIMQNLVAMYERTMAANAIPIPITVPSIRIDGDGHSPDARAFLTHHLERRSVLNQLIIDYARSHGLAYFDLFEETADPASRMLASDYSNDGLHFSTEGYRRFGTLLYQQVIEPNLADWRTRVQA